MGQRTDELATEKDRIHKHKPGCVGGRDREKMNKEHCLRNHSYFDRANIMLPRLLISQLTNSLYCFAAILLAGCIEISLKLSFV